MATATFGAVEHPMRLQRGRQSERKRKTARERCTERQTEIYSYSNFGVLSQPYWETVHTELSTEIRYWSFHPLPSLPSLFVSPSLAMGIHITKNTLFVIPSLSLSHPLVLSFFLSLLRFSSAWVIVIYAFLLCKLCTLDIRRDLRMRCEDGGIHATHLP